MRMSRRLAIFSKGTYDPYYPEPTAITPTRWRRYGSGVDNADHFHYQNNAVWIYISLDKKAHEISIDLHCNSISSSSNYYRQKYEKIAIFKSSRSFDPLSGSKHSTEGVEIDFGYGTRSATDATVNFTVDSDGGKFEPGNYIFYIWRYLDTGYTNHYTGTMSATITAS